MPNENSLRWTTRWIRAGMAVVTAALVLLMLPATMAWGQGAHTIEQGPVSTGYWHGWQGEITALQPASVHRVSFMADYLQPIDVQLWVKPGGLSSAQPWQLVGTENLQAPNNTTWVEFPVNVGVNLGTNESLGIAFITVNPPTSWVLRYLGSGFMNPVSNSHMRIEGVGDGLEYNASLNPPFSPVWSPRMPIMRVSYDVDGLEATLNGPSTARTSAPGSAGPTGVGEVLADISLEAILADHYADELIFQATAGNGGDAAIHLNNVALYEDTDGSGDLSPADQLVSQVGSFNASGEFTADLLDDEFLDGVPRRFFLVAIIDTSTPVGATFTARLESISLTAPANAVALGVPTADAADLTIQAPSLTVARAASSPPGEMIDANEDPASLDSQELLHLHLSTTSFAPVEVEGLDLTLGGNADWTQALQSGDGLEVWADISETGEVDPAADTLLFAGDATGLVGDQLATPFSLPQTVPASGELVLIVRARFGAEAATSVGQTFVVSVAEASDVDAVAPAVVSLGTPPPEGEVLELYRFEVTGFSPTLSIPQGGGEIEVTGSGFRAPVTIHIGSVEVTGTANVNAEATRIDGIQVPPGELGVYEITYEDPRKGLVTLPMTFRYGSISAGSRGCASHTANGGDASGTWLMLLLLLGMTLVLSRRQRLAA